MKIKQEYILGYSMKSICFRKYKFTIEDGDKKGKCFFSEVSTPKINEFEYGKAETIYYKDGQGQIFKKAENCIDSL